LCSSKNPSAQEGTPSEQEKTSHSDYLSAYLLKKALARYTLQKICFKNQKTRRAKPRCSHRPHTILCSQEVQFAHNAKVVLGGCKTQRRDTIQKLRVTVCTCIQQHTHYLGVPAIDGIVQGRVSNWIGGLIDRGIMIQKHAHDMSSTNLSGVVKRSPPTVVWGILVCTVLQ
jgi:hypothetical protein